MMLLKSCLWLTKSVSIFFGSSLDQFSNYPLWKQISKVSDLAKIFPEVRPIETLKVPQPELSSTSEGT